MSNRKKSGWSRWRWQRRTAYIIAGIIVVLIGLRLALPHVLRYYVNRELNKSHDYSGKVGKVTVHLWRGAYEIHNINIFKKTGKIPEPFFSAPLMDLSLQWDELIHGAFVSKIVMKSPRLNFVSGPTKQQTQTGQENNWANTLKSLVPFKINSLDVTNGQIHFQNPYSNPAVDIYITDVLAEATNFTNARHMPGKLPAGVVAKGKALGNGGLDFQIHLNPMAKTPTFELTGQLTNVNLPSLNNFMRAYGKFDVARGDFALFTSFAAKNGAYDGYCKVFFKNLKVFKLKKEMNEDKNPLEIFWDAIVGTVATVFKNQSQDQLATKIPITGTFQTTDVHVWPTVGTLLQNAFIRALVPKPDQPVKTQDVKKP